MWGLELSAENIFICSIYLYTVLCNNSVQGLLFCYPLLGRLKGLFVCFLQIIIGENRSRRYYEQGQLQVILY